MITAFQPFNSLFSLLAFFHETALGKIYNRFLDCGKGKYHTLLEDYRCYHWIIFVILLQEVLVANHVSRMKLK